MMHIYNDIIERNDGESENNIIRGGMIMLRVDFTFDKKIIEKNGSVSYTHLTQPTNSLV